MDVVLHIGTGKTGTTAVQAVLGHSRAALRSHGILYPRAFGHARHRKFGFLVAPDDQLVESPEWWRVGNSDTDPAAFRRAVRRRLQRELTADVHTMLISDEGLCRRNDATVRGARRFVDERGGAVRVVAYVRPQDDHVASNYQQVVKGGAVDRIDEFAASDLAHTYDYHGNLARWRDHLAPDAFVVRVFDPRSFVGGSLVDDFLDAAGLDVSATDLTPLARRNESLSAEAVEMLRILNLHRVERHGARVGRIINTDHIARLRQVPGPTLVLRPDARARFLERWADSNRRLVAEFLDGRADALGSSPPDPSRTTFDQRLDPDRLDHFFDLLEVPEQDRAAIRAIAEREAAAGRRPEAAG